MVNSNTDLKKGVVGNLGVKAPCRVCTAANIDLEGLQTINGIILEENDRVLVRLQTDLTENGIYIASTSEWERAVDFDDSLDGVPGSLIFVNEGSGTNELSPKTLWSVTCDDFPIVFGTSEITFTFFAIASDVGIYLTSVNNLSDVDDVSLSRQNLGLAIDSDVQAYNVNLQALSGLTGAANKVPSFTGLGIMALLTTGVSLGNLPLIGTSSATEALAGLAELATQAETNAGTDDLRIVTPLKLKTSVYNSRELISTSVASSSASIDFINLTSTYSKYEVDFDNIIPTTNGAGLIMQFSIDNGVTYINSLYESDGLYHEAGAGAGFVDTSNNATRFTLVGFDASSNRGISNTSTKGGLSGSIQIFNPTSTTQHKVFGDVVYPINGADYIANFYVFGRQFGTTTVNAIRFKMSTANADINQGTITSGTFKLYGVK